MREALSPEDPDYVSFNTSRRGYDRNEVDAYLRDIAAELKEARELRSERMYEGLGEEIGSLLQHAKDSADDMQAQAEKDAATTRSEAEADARRLRQDATNHAGSIKANAEHDATARIKEADERVAALELQEVEIRERIKSLRTELESITDLLRPLEVPASDERGQASDEESRTTEGGPRPVTMVQEQPIHLDDQVEIDRAPR